MAKTILIPIDFQADSLNTLKIVLENNASLSINVVLLYAETLSDSITELLFYKPEKSITTLTSAEFAEALEIIKNRFEGSIENISIKLFHGINRNAMKAFCEANHIDAIYIHKTYKLKQQKRSFNPVSLLQKSKLPIIEVE